MYNLSCTGTGKTAACRTTVTVGSQRLDTIIDKGASRTVISKSAYDKVASQLDPLEPVKMQLRSASGDACKLLGEVTLLLRIHDPEYKA